MSNRIIIHFPEVERVAEQLVAHADVIEQTHHRMNRSAEALYRAGLEGQFVDELDAHLAMLRNWFSTCAAEVSEAGQDLATVAVWARQADEECALLFQTGGTLESGAAIALLAQGWDGGYTGWPPDQADMIFINGIWTQYGGEDGHFSRVEDLQQRFQDRRVMGIYNQTEGFWDLPQALEDAFQTGDYSRLIENPAVNSLVRTIEQNPGRPYELMAHSQGAAITAAALCVLASRGVDLSHLKVNTFGGAGMVYPKGPTYNHYIFPNDWVTHLRSAGTALFWDSMTADLPFEVDPIIDDLHIVSSRSANPFFEHDLGQYLDNYGRATPSLSSFVKETEISASMEHAGQIWKQTTSLGEWGRLDASLLDTRFSAGATMEWDATHLTAQADLDAHAYLGSFNLEADVAGFDAAVHGFAGAEAEFEGKVLIDPFSGDATLGGEAGAFAGTRMTGELSRDFGAIETEASAGLSYGLGATLGVDIVFEGGVFRLEADANAAVGLGANAGAAVELDVTEAAATVTQSAAGLVERVLML